MPILGEISTCLKSLDADVEWTIPNFFSFLKRDGIYYGSSFFSFSGHKWYFVIPPSDSGSDDSSGYLDLELWKSSHGPPVRLEFSVSIKTLNGRKEHEVHGTKDFGETYFHQFRQFVSISELSRRHSELMPDDTLTLLFTIKNTTSAENAKKIRQLGDQLRVVSQELQAEKEKLKEMVSELQSTKQDNLCLKSDVRSLSAAHDKLRLHVAIAIIVLAGVAGCVLGCFKMPLSSSHCHEELLPRPVLVVTDVSSTYLEVAWDLPEESKINSARYIFNFRKSGDQWQEVSLPDLSRNSYSLTNLDPGVSYEISVRVVNFSGSSTCSEVAVIRTFNKTVEAVKKIQASEINQTIDRSVVVGSNESGAAANKEAEGVSKKLAAELSKADHSGSANVPEASASSRADGAETTELDLPKSYEEQPFPFVAVICLIFFESACAYAYSKALYEEETKAISTEEVTNIKAEKSDVAVTDKSEVSDSNLTCATEPKEPVINLPEDYSFVSDIKQLLEENRGVDVTFELETQSGKTEFFAHQLILAARSPYFAEEFYSEGRNKEHLVIPLKGINCKAFEQTIRFCYGEKPSLETAEEAWVLFKVASKFKVMNLQNLCHTFFKQTKIDHRNVFSILKISEEMQDKSLGEMCYKILQDKTREIMETYELGDVTPAMVHTILDLPKLSLNSEYELIKWIFDWARVKSQAQDSSSESAREYLEKLLQEMNILALTFEEFSTLCKDNQDFFNSDEIANISLNIAYPGTREMPDWYDEDLKCRVYTGLKE